jgi:hypothetical protein
MDSDIAYFEDQNSDTLSIIKYKAGDYIPDDELNELFTKVSGKSILQEEISIYLRNQWVI